MSNKIDRIEYPELFFGIVAPIGVDVRDTVEYLTTILESQDYHVTVIKITDVFPKFSQKIQPKLSLKQFPFDERLSTYIAYGDQLRDHFEDDAILSYVAIANVVARRAERFREGEAPTKVAYILRQFKRKEEIDLLRSVYGRLFFQISVYTKRNSRVDRLSRNIASSHNDSDLNQFRYIAEQLVVNDHNEQSHPHGQRLGKIFHEADFFINTEASTRIQAQIERFVHLLFGSNTISPTKQEYGLFLAKAASMRSLDLSRQVGAAIFTSNGEIIALGSNEVPKAGGGTYWCDDAEDDRDYKRKIDSNYKRKVELLSELFPQENRETLASRFKDSQFMDALEYGRIIHAEMSAISDAARMGRSTKNTILFVTTFPCHMCAKHIVAAGIEKVIFLEPYPKSLAGDLHSDSIQIEGQGRDHYDGFGATKFIHFYGVPPRRYRELFEKGARKSSDGNLLEWQHKGSPLVEIRFPAYIQLELVVLETMLIPLLDTGNITLADIQNT